MEVIINFYNEKFKINLSNDFNEFKNTLKNEICLNESDINELKIIVDILNEKKIIDSEETFNDILKDKNNIKNITIEISENSKLYQKTLEEIKKDENLLKNKINNGDSNMKKKIIHYGIICDGCNKNDIEGIRYKCMVCPDFDYCEKCEALYAEKHRHPFLKMRKPQVYNNI